ncbi:MAG: PEP-CTERM sorting domain-containing protein, partial [Planctomycetota bacterium]|nr:PEP-CTERM sorting domain-containing protein [Planctomycetota bacterium]
QTDSFVTMQNILNGWGTALDPSFAVPYGPLAHDIAPPGNTNAGWYDSTPGTPNLVGAGLKVRLMQIARLTSTTSVFTANMTLGYAAFGATTPLFGYGSFTIGVVPAPGALALLGLAGAFGRRRRS